MKPVTGDKVFASRVRYWRGFALWRKVLNGFNDTTDWSSQEPDLNRAVEEFNEASRLDPAFVDAKVAAASCLSNLMFLNRKDPDRVKELLSREIPLVKDAQNAEPENPRLLWVVGANRWNIPPERGGGQQAALDTYQKGLEAARKHKAAAGDPLEPSWGEPELLMNLGWANLNRATPDLAAAEQYARAALQIVPYWHYVRDILLPQVLAAKKKAADAK